MPSFLLCFRWNAGPLCILGKQAFYQQSYIPVPLQNISFLSFFFFSPVLFFILETGSFYVALVGLECHM